MSRMRLVSCVILSDGSKATEAQRRVSQPTALLTLSHTLTLTLSHSHTLTPVLAGLMQKLHDHHVQSATTTIWPSGLSCRTELLSSGDMQSLRSHHDKLLCTPLDCSCQAHCSGVRLFGLLDPRMPYQPACSRRRWLQIGGRRLHSAVHAPERGHKHILCRHAATPPRRHGKQALHAADRRGRCCWWHVRCYPRPPSQR